MEIEFQIDKRTCGSDFFDALHVYLSREEIEKMRIRIADEVFAAAGLDGVSVLIGKITGLKEPQKVVLDIPDSVPDWRIGDLIEGVAKSLGSFVAKVQDINNEGKKSGVTAEDFKASRKRLKKLIENVPTDIEEELASTSNAWLACFKGPLLGLAGCLANIKQLGGLPGAEFVEWGERLAALRKLVEAVERKYGWDPPDEIKARLLKELSELPVCAD